MEENQGQMIYHYYAKIGWKKKRGNGYINSYKNVEFVSRADAVLGAGILSGGDPKSYKSMRKAGADFFYDQQKKLKRIYDLVNDNKTNTVQ